MSRELTPSMRRSVLIAALRDPSMWPEGFEWDFTDCETCAVGLFEQLMRVDAQGDGECTSDFMARHLGIPEPQAYATFVSMFPYEREYANVAHHSDVVPGMVADRLEQIHRELESAP